MGLFGRDKDPERELAKAIAKRGVQAQARIESMHETGETRGGGVSKEIELRLSFTPAGGSPAQVTVRQFLNDLTLTGLAPGEPASISYDRDDPTKVVIWGSPKYRIAEPGVPVRIDDPRFER